MNAFLAPPSTLLLQLTLIAATPAGARASSATDDAPAVIDHVEIPLDTAAQAESGALNQPAAPAAPDATAAARSHLPKEREPFAPRSIPGAHTQSAIVHANGQATRKSRLPIFGLGADVGVPDGANLSLVARPCAWARSQIAIGSNSISHGVRVGVTLLPLGHGPGLVAEYGHYQDGNANPLAARLMGSGFQPSPLLERIGYDYLNLQLGMNFGYQRVVFFVQGGLSMVWGHIHNVGPFVRGTTGDSGSTEVVVHSDPTAKATGIAGKLGFLVYVW